MLVLEVVQIAVRADVFQPSDRCCNKASGVVLDSYQELFAFVVPMLV
jgi:hypothetical protein